MSVPGLRNLHQFLDQNLFLPETDILHQFLDPEIYVMDLFLDPIKVLILDPESNEKYLFMAKANSGSRNFCYGLATVMVLPLGPPDQPSTLFKLKVEPSLRAIHCMVGKYTTKLP